jgi:cell division protein FtsW (lipid II flippase)
MLALGWRALVAANFSLPEGMVRIVAQGALCVFAMHLLARAIAPRARPEILPLVSLLACTGLIFVTRLAPGAAAQQANWLAIGTVALGAGMVAGRQSRRLKQLTYTSGLLAVLTLVATGLFGQTINGARLWVSVAGQSVQTTEFIKAFFILFLAGYLTDAGGVLARPAGRFAGVAAPAVAYVLPLALVLMGAVAALALLRDLGSIAILLLLAIAMLYLATGRLRFAAAGLGLVLATGFIGYLVFGHVQARVDAWLDPHANPSGTGYQSLQATYAVNAGGITGAGLGRGMPAVVPAASTDYVYTAVAEELGLAGAAGVALAFLILVHVGLRVVAESPDTYDRYLSAAVALLIGIQAAVIIAGNLRLIPTTGITLPFVSYGGSSLVVNLGLVGLMLGVSHASRSRPD